MTFKTAALAACAFFCAFTTHAQDLKKPFSLQFGVEFGRTNGATRNEFSGMGGLTTGLSLHAGHGFVTLGTGFLLFIPTSATEDRINSAASYQVPVLVGYKYVFLHEHLFIKGELGDSHFTHDYHGIGVPSVNSWGPTLAASIGCQFNQMELALKHEIFPSTGLNIRYYAFHVGFNF